MKISSHSPTPNRLRQSFIDRLYSSPGAGWTCPCFALSVNIDIGNTKAMESELLDEQRAVIHCLRANRFQPQPQPQPQP